MGQLRQRLIIWDIRKRQHQFQVLLTEASEPNCFLPDSSRPSCQASPQQVPRGILAHHDKKMGLLTRVKNRQLMTISKCQSFQGTELRPSLLETISVVHELILYLLIPAYKLWDGETTQNEMERIVQEERWGRRESGNNRTQKS